MIKKQYTGGWAFVGFVFVLAMMAGCEGSGSSGFDENPRLVQEQSVLGEVDSSKECKTLDGVKFCRIVNSQGNNGNLAVTIKPDLQSGVSCVFSVSSGQCELKMSITTADRFVVAVRYQDPVSSLWRITASSNNVVSPDLNKFEADIPFELSAEKTAKVDFAVLAYQNKSQVLPDLGKEELILGDFKPSVAYVALNVAVATTTP